MTPSELTRRRLDRQDLLIRPPDELDLATVAPFVDRLSEVGPNENVIIDLRHLEFCDATGLKALLDATHRIEALGSCVTLSHPPPNFERLLSICGLDGQFAIRRPAASRRRRHGGTDSSRR